MPLKVANLAGEITSESVAAAFQYAWENGVSVLNMSLGGPGDPGVPEFFQALVDTATAHGVLCVAAAGNDGTDVPSYPAGCNHVLSVGATDGSNARAEFSNSWLLGEGCRAGRRDVVGAVHELRDRRGLADLLHLLLPVGRRAAVHVL